MGSYFLSWFPRTWWLAFMYYDMYYATQAAVHEVRKMRELRKEIQIERMYGQ